MNSCIYKDEVLMSLIADGREKKLRLRLRQRMFADCRRKYGKVLPQHEVFLKRAICNHERSVKKCRYIHSIFRNT